MDKSDERFAGAGFLGWSAFFLLVYLIESDWLVEYDLLGIALVASAAFFFMFAVLYILLATFEYRRMREYARRHLAGQSLSWFTATAYAVGTGVLVALTVATQSEGVSSIILFAVPAAGVMCFLFSRWNLRRVLEENSQEQT